MKRSLILALGLLPWYTAFAEDITYPDDSSTHLGTINLVPDSFGPSAASPSNNTVRIAVNAGNGITGNVYGGYEILENSSSLPEFAGSHGNTVELLGGNTTIGGDVYGGNASAQVRTYGVDSTAQSESHGNSVAISGGEAMDVFGGHSR